MRAMMHLAKMAEECRSAYSISFSGESFEFRASIIISASGSSNNALGFVDSFS